MTDAAVSLPRLVVYSRPGCHLCEVLVEELLPLLRERATLEVRDIDTRADWRDRYGLEIPVVELDGERLCHFSLDRGAVLAALAKHDAARPADR